MDHLGVRLAYLLIKSFHAKTSFLVHTSSAVPDASFDESFYRAFYPDVDEAIKFGRIPSGEFHFRLVGKREGRIPTYNSSRTLEAKFASITLPLHLQQVAPIKRLLSAPVSSKRVSGAPVLWVLLRNFNPDLLFAGYIAFFEFVSRAVPYLNERGYIAKILVTDEDYANRHYFFWHPAGRPYSHQLSGIEILGRDEALPVRIGEKDLFIAYSVWDAHIAAQLTSQSRHKKVIQFIQEYEPAFHPFSSIHALASAAYQLNTYPIFNSEALQEYFEANKIGIFQKHCGRPAEYSVFEHVVTPVAPNLNLRGSERTLLVYARPEAHAARNLYELCEICLEELCRSGEIGPQWRIFGIGTLSDLPPRQLGNRHELVFLRKMPLEAYRTLLSTADIGLSLMYAPHPSVVPFEMASSGALVVTNTFENRDQAYFENISKNIIPCTPTIDGVLTALRQALARVDDFHEREKHIYKVDAQRTWDSVFGEQFLGEIFDRYLGGAGQSCAR